ncbi:MAG: DUF5320 domain-containing protein [Bacteroidales bacterium]|nr:DUF5320 domain-containing protein [Bacteroidales bacterium]
MPRRDGTGPQGQGSGTGRGMGICKSNVDSNPETQTLNNRFGRRNACQGKGRGNRGQNQGFNN